MESKSKVAIKPFHLFAALVIFSAIIFLGIKVIVKYAVKKPVRNKRKSGLPSVRITLLKKTPLYAKPDIKYKLEGTISRGTKLIADKKVISEEKWTFYRTKIDERYVWIIGQFLQNKPVIIPETGILPIGKEKVDVNTPLPFDYQPHDLVKVPKKFNTPYDNRTHYLRKPALEVFKKVINHAKEQGIKLYIISAFRSAKYQMRLYKRAIRKKGPTWMGTAKPTYSEHQLGTTVDFTCKEAGYNIGTHFENTRAFRFLMENSKKYGLKLSYTRNNKQGYIYEPWHFRYIGKR